MGTLDDMQKGMPADKQVFGTLMEAVGAHEEAERIALGRAIVEEYKKLLERRVAEDASAEDAGAGGSHREPPEDHEGEILCITEQFLPQVAAGSFDLVVQPGGMIAVEASDRRIALHAPDSNWDEEFEASVKKLTAGNGFAEKVFAKKEANKESFRASSGA